MTIPLRPGETAYLTPKTRGAPRVAWSQPACTVVATGPGTITVRLEDGSEVTTASANVVRTLPTPPVPRPRRPAGPPPWGAPVRDEQGELF